MATFTLTRGIGVLGASAVLFVAGCGGSDDGSTDDSAGTTAATDDSSFTVEPSASASASGGDDDADDTSAGSSAADGAGAAGDSNREAALAAISTAAGSQADGKVYDVELDDDDDQRWEIKVASGGQGYKVYVSLDGASVISQEADDDDNDDIQAIGNASVDAATALQTAIDAKGGSLDEMEIDEDDGTLKWDIELDVNGDDVEADVDATSGALLN